MLILGVRRCRRLQYECIEAEDLPYSSIQLNINGMLGSTLIDVTSDIAMLSSGAFRGKRSALNAADIVNLGDCDQVAIRL